MKYIKKGKVNHLSDLKLGQSAIVKGLNIENKAIRRRLLDMGITNGVKVKIKKIAPLGDPACIELRGYELCLRKSDMEHIEVQL